MLRRLRSPWDPARPSILEHVRSHLPPPGEVGLLGGDALPDEGEQAGELRWAPGARDGVGAHHFGVDYPDQAVGALVVALRACADKRGGLAARVKLYELAKCGEALEMVDPLLARIRAVGIPPDLIRPTARWLVTEGRHRDAVKVGIALLGLGHDEDERDILKALGRHEEFTLYVAVALANTAEHADRELYELAKGVEGWSRIELVERLKNTGDPEIREWIYRGGFRNAVMDEYLAYIAATTGDLLGRLAGSPDDEELDAACDIIAALLQGGPAQDIDDHSDAPPAVLRLLELLNVRASRLSHLLVVDGIARFVAGEDGWDERRSGRWTEDIRERADNLAEQIKTMPRWEEMAARGLASDDDAEFHEAAKAARVLGHDTFAAHWRRLVANPIKGNWYAVMQFADDTRIAGIVEFAVRSLPLDEIASGPAMELGMGPGWAAHRALTFIVQDLGRFPSHGWPLVNAAIRSPVVPNRNMAIKVLEEWDRRDWPADAVWTIKQALSGEPDHRVRERLRKLLRKHSVNDPD